MTTTTEMNQRRITAEQAREQILKLLKEDTWLPPKDPQRENDPRMGIEAIIGLDNWPPADPGERAISVLDNEDENPWLVTEDIHLCTCCEIASVLLAYKAHLDFESGRAAERASRGEPVVERTPETVLRAMLTAYEAASLETTIAYFRTDGPSVEENVSLARCTAIGCKVEIIRDALGALLAGRDAFAVIDFRELWPDYDGRLSGARPLDAAPLEV